MTEAFNLSATYGKQSVPVLKVIKKGDVHSIFDMIVNIMLEGDVKGSWLSGDNKGILPTETQKNTCYALALETPFDSLGEYGQALAKDILARHSHLSAVTLLIHERRWQRIMSEGRPHNHSFMSTPDPIRRSCELRLSRKAGVEYVKSGVIGIKLLKTTQSGFDGFIRDKYTNLQPVGKGAKGGAHRLMSTKMDASWTFTSPPANMRAVNDAVLTKLLETFSGPPDTGTYSRSLQETTYRMAVAVLKSQPHIESVDIWTPNVHFYRYPLEQFGLSNPNVVYQSTDPETTASGRIVTHVSRTAGKPSAQQAALFPVARL